MAKLKVFPLPFKDLNCWFQLFSSSVLSRVRTFLWYNFFKRTLICLTVLTSCNSPELISGKFSFKLDKPFFFWNTNTFTLIHPQVQLREIKLGIWRKSPGEIAVFHAFSNEYFLFVVPPWVRNVLFFIFFRFLVWISLGLVRGLKSYGL